MPLSARICRTGTNGNITVSEGDSSSEGKPETEVNPVPAIVVSLPTVDKLKVKPNLTPPPGSDETDVYVQAARKHGIMDQPNPTMSVTSETLVEVTRRRNDPRLGYPTPYYWRERPEMRKYYELPIEVPAVPGQKNLGSILRVSRKRSATVNCIWWDRVHLCDQGILKWVQ